MAPPPERPGASWQSIAPRRADAAVVAVPRALPGRETRDLGPHDSAHLKTGGTRPHAATQGAVD